MSDFSNRVIAWYHHHGRKHLPWQINHDPYRIWVSEIMLQQTQVTTVIPYFNRFMDSFPDVLALANAELDEVLSHWAGLGYYSRARNLHKAAQSIRDNHQGAFPQDIDAVIELSGIGRSTAGAVLSLAFGQQHAILDGNVKRVLSRHQMVSGVPNQSLTVKKLWSIAEQLMPDSDCGAYTQAMMDLGAMVCTRSKPRCDACPVVIDCQAKQNDCIADYPNKKPKKVLPEKSATMLIVTDGERVYLEKRPETGIWGGLWSLPEVETDAINDFLASMDLDSISHQTLSVYTHVFTHYRLFITPVMINVSQLKQGFDKQQITEIGLPTPIKKILSKVI